MHYVLALLVCLIGLPRQADAQPRECPTGTLTSGETISGVLELADCQVRDLVSGSTSAALAKRYQLEVGEKAVFTFTVAATGYTPVLTIYNSLGRLVGANTAAAGTGTARILIHLPAGPYNIITYGSGTAAVGTFELKAVHELPRPCPIVELPESGALEDSFSASSCRFVDLNELSTNAQNVALYRYPLTRRGVLGLESETAITRFSTVLVTQTLTPFTAGKQLTVSLAPGTHTISVSSPDMGSFTLRTHVEDMRECPRTPIEVGAEVNATLETGGCRWLDEFVPSTDATPVNLYRFTVDKRAVVQMDQTSDVLDTYVALMTESRGGLATGDSRIVIHLVPGNYVVIATAYPETTTGGYKLKIAGETPRSCEPLQLTSGVSLDGRVPAEGCRVLDYIALSTLADLVVPFHFDAAEPTMLALKAEGATASTLRAVTTQGLEVVRQTADRNGNIPVEFRLPTGPLHVLMTSTGVTKPAFKLEAQTRAIPDCPATPLEPNAELEGVLAAEDCKVNELVNYLSLPTPAQRFQLEVPARGRLSIELEPATFWPLLGVTNDQHQLLGLVTATSPTKLTLINPAVEPGTVKILASATSVVLGAFKVRNVFTPEEAPAKEAVERLDWQRLHERVETPETPGLEGKSGRKRPAKVFPLLPDFQ